jgi:hypothetical protein
MCQFQRLMVALYLHLLEQGGNLLWTRKMWRWVIIVTCPETVGVAIDVAIGS